MIISSELEMLNFGQSLARDLRTPALIELVGDVGTGKTTFTRGLALGLGIKEPITSPSFTINKRYQYPNGELSHYDFYRLDDPGLISSELAEDLSDSQVITVIEWGSSVADLLPPDHLRIIFTLNDNDTRTVALAQGDQHA